MRNRLLLKVILGFLGLASVNTALLYRLHLPFRSEIQNRWDAYVNRGKKGFVRRVYHDNKGREFRYTVFIPYQLKEGARPPMLVFLHGLTNNGSDGFSHVRECLAPIIWRTRNTFPFIVVFPQCPLSSTWWAEDIAGKLTVNLTRQTLRDYNADSDRVYLTGVSSGGLGAWSIAAAHADIFAATVPISAESDTKLMAGALADAQLPVWSLYVTGDFPEVVDANRRMRKVLLAEGLSPIFTEIDGTLSSKWWRHNAWDFAYRNEAMFSWLLRQSRQKNAASKKNPFRRILVADKLAQLPELEIAGSTPDDEAIVRRNNSQSDRKPSAIKYDTTLKNFELHFEFRFEAGQQFEFSLDANSAENVVLEVAKPDFGSGGVYSDISKECLQMAAPTAQRGVFNSIWNDLRISIENDHLIVDVNGHRLQDLKHAQLLDRSSVFSIRTSTEDRIVQFRNFRIREIQ